MSDILHLSVEEPRLLQLTDLHLSAGQQTLMGIDCHSTLAAVLAEAELLPGPDLTLLTGDLSQDRTISSYEDCHSAMAHFETPVAWIPGNHDDVQLMHQHLAKAPFVTDKQILFPRWQLLLLNSQLPGQTCGSLSAEELTRIEQAAAEYPEHHLMLILHHHPILMDSEWIDHHRLLNHEELWLKLAGLPQIKGILFGHVHQEVDCLRQGVRVLASPATSVQFKPGQDEFGLDLRQPGFRQLQLKDDGSINTQIHRLREGQFIAVDDPRGY